MLGSRDPAIIPPAPFLFLSPLISPLPRRARAPLHFCPCFFSFLPLLLHLPPCNGYPVDHQFYLQCIGYKRNKGNSEWIGQKAVTGATNGGAIRHWGGIQLGFRV